MFARIVPALVFVTLIANTAAAQTIRFDTNVGNIDLVLNPTNNINLQGHVDNMLDYVNAGVYNHSVINRAVEGFIIQIGSFSTRNLSVPQARGEFIPLPRRGSVTVDFDGDNEIDFNTDGLSNTRGKVSMALGGAGANGGPDVNSGTGSFFVTTDNTSGAAGQLDPGAINPDGQGNPAVTGGFVVFAEVVDMSTIDFIASLNNVNLFGDDPRFNPTFTDAPLLDNDFQVFIERAFVLEEAPMAMAALAPGSGDAGDSFTPPALNTLSVPEPPALVLAVAALMGIAILSRCGIG